VGKWRDKGKGGAIAPGPHGAMCHIETRIANTNTTVEWKSFGGVARLVKRQLTEPSDEVTRATRHKLIKHSEQLSRQTRDVSK